MADFLFGDDIVKAIKRYLSQAKQADFAVAYWGKGATKRLGLNKIDIPVRILCDLTSGACNPFELEKLLRPNFKLKSKAGLHAKVYITANGVITGSANASTNGLGAEGDESDLNLEAAIACSEQKVVADANKWFKEHWDSADLIDKNWLHRIKPLWRLRLRAFDLLPLLARAPDSFRQMPIRLAVFKSLDDAEYDDAWTKVSHRFTEEQRKRYAAGFYPIYIDHSSRWSIKPGEYIVSYWVEPSGRKINSLKITDQGGVWRVRGPERIQGKNGKGSKSSWRTRPLGCMVSNFRAKTIINFDRPFSTIFRRMQTRSSRKTS